MAVVYGENVKGQADVGRYCRLLDSLTADARRKRGKLSGRIDPSEIVLAQFHGAGRIDWLEGLFGESRKADAE
jgi:hypothetical protein